MSDNSFGNTETKNQIVSDALKFTNSHYENFPVASLLLPKGIRNHVAIVYRFARQADDIADEGNIPNEQRIRFLDNYRLQLSDSLNGKYADKFWEALHCTIKSFNLTHKYFFDLLSAFEQDITKHRYNLFEDVLDYCKRSANPVGRIILEFFNIHDQKAIEYSDAICTALQLTNFYQDFFVDWQKGRIYIPVSEVEKFGVDEKIFSEPKINANFRELLRLQVDRTYNIFKKGKLLLPILPKRLRFQIRLTILGGEEILKKIEKNNFNVLNYRPKLSKIDYVKLVLKAAIS